MQAAALAVPSSPGRDPLQVLPGNATLHYHPPPLQRSGARGGTAGQATADHLPSHDRQKCQRVTHCLQKGQWSMHVCMVRLTKSLQFTPVLHRTHTHSSPQPCLKFAHTHTQTVHVPVPFQSSCQELCRDQLHLTLFQLVLALLGSLFAFLCICFSIFLVLIAAINVSQLEERVTSSPPQV